MKNLNERKMQELIDQMAHELKQELEEIEQRLRELKRMVNQD